MSLAGGDLTTLARVKAWAPGLTTASDAIIGQFIGSMTASIYTKLNRARLFSQQFVRTFDGVGTYQILLPDWPVTAVSSVQVGSAIIQPSPLGSSSNTFGYGYRFVPWSGSLPGDPSVLEFVNGAWGYGPQSIKITYTAGYLVASEPATIPATPFTVTVAQTQGICCKDAGVVYASTGIALTVVTGTPSAGQYNAPADTSPGVYTFAAADTGLHVLISYSFVPADLEEACIQMIAERLSYRSRVGEIEKSLGGQETVRFMRGGNRGQRLSGIPPEVEDLIWPYVSVTPPAIGAPV